MKNKYMVGEVSKFLNISKDTLRYYDQIGIVTPKRVGKMDIDITLWII